MFETVFYYYLQDLNNNNYSSDIYKIFLNEMTDEYKEKTSNERIVIDYIAGMTDDFFTTVYNTISR